MDRPLTEVDRRQFPPNATREHADEVTICRVDSPRRQQQYDYTVSLSSGGLLIDGPLGTGKTTALLTAGCSFLTPALHDPGYVIAVDAGGGTLARALPPRAALPVAGEDAEAVTLLVDRLTAVLDRRKRGEVDYWGQSGRVALLLLLDNIPGLVSTLGRHRAARWYERLVQLIAQGRDFGVYAVGTTPRIIDVPGDLRDAFKHSVSLGPESDSATPLDGELIGGRGRLSSGDEVQVYVTDDLATSEASAWPAPFFGRSVALRASDLEPAARLSGEELIVYVGFEEVAGGAVAVTLGSKHLLVVGAEKSGKSNALRVLAHNIWRSEQRPLTLISARPQVGSEQDPWWRPVPLDELVGLCEALGSMGEANEERLAVDFRDRFCRDTVAVGGRPLVVIDDGHLLRRNADVLNFIERAAEMQQLSFVISSDVARAMYSGWETIKTGSRQVLFLRPLITDEQNDGSRVIEHELAQRPSATYPIGRGILYSQGRQTTLQVPIMPKSEEGSSIRHR